VGSNNDRRPVVQEKKGVTVAKVIEFYRPNNFRKNVKWVPHEQRGKIIEFASQIKKSA
jgi:hypothetical protein